MYITLKHFFESIKYYIDIEGSLNIVGKTFLGKYVLTYVPDDFDTNIFYLDTVNDINIRETAFFIDFPGTINLNTLKETFGD